MARPLRTFGALLAGALSAASAEVLLTRQAASMAAVYYGEQVETVLYVINKLRDDDALEACSDSGLSDRVSQRGLDGDLAQTLLCEEAAGIDIFHDLDGAENELEEIHKVLRLAMDGEAPTCTTDLVDIEFLDNVGLDGKNVWRAACANPLTDAPASSSALASVPISATSSTTASSREGSFIPVMPSSSSSASFSGSDTSARFSVSSSSVPIFVTGPEPPPSSTLPIFTTTPAPTTSSALPIVTTTPGSTTLSPSSSASTSPSPPAIVVVTTFFTVTITPSSSPTADSNAGAANDDIPTLPALPPLRFTLESRAAQEQPAGTSALDPAPSILWTWTIGPPVSFPTPRVTGLVFDDDDGRDAAAATTTTCLERV